MQYSRKDWWILTFCRLGPAGLSPIMPGTCGSLLALVLGYFVFIPLPIVAKVVVLIAIFFAGSLASTRAEILLEQKDPGSVVIDELLGMWIVLLPLTEPDATWMLSALVCFRFFDMLKPWPINKSENWLPKGYGIMLDDAVAGIISVLVLRGIFFVIANL